MERVPGAAPGFAVWKTAGLAVDLYTLIFFSYL
jgi:hypothetical protein